MGCHAAATTTGDRHFKNRAHRDRHGFTLKRVAPQRMTDKGMTDSREMSNTVAAIHKAAPAQHTAPQTRSPAHVMLLSFKRDPEYVPEWPPTKDRHS